MLYNIYLRSGENRQSKYAVTHEDVISLIEAINIGRDSVVVDARRFQLRPFDTLNIFDFSKNEVSLKDRGIVKDLMRKAERIFKKGPVFLFQHYGVDVTYKFKIKPQNAYMPVVSKTEKKIFISHSSKDRDLVGKLIDLIELIKVPTESIFCSSYEGYGIELGENFLDRLKKELNNDVLVLFVLTDNFYSSPICLCEMGAAWMKTAEHIPVIVPPLGFQDVKGVFPLTQGLIINDSNKLNSLKERLEKAFGISSGTHSSVWERKRNDILKQINSILESHPPKVQEQISIAHSKSDAISEHDNFPTLKQLVVKDYPKSESEWVLCYAFLASDFGNQTFAKEAIIASYKESKRNTSANMGNLTNNLNRCIAKDWVKDVNRSEFILTPIGIEYAKEILVGNSKTREITRIKKKRPSMKK